MRSPVVMESSSGRVGTNVHLTIASNGACCARAGVKVEGTLAAVSGANGVVFPALLYDEGTGCGR